MKKIDIIKSFSLEDLKVYLSLVDSYGSIDEMRNELITEINRREEEKNKSLNARFTIEMFKEYNMFYQDEMYVLEINGIRNLQDLIDCDLDSLVGINASIKEKLSWARNFYNMKPITDSKVKQKGKGKKQL